MNKYLKYTLRVIIISLPILFTVESIVHLKTCRVHEKCGYCVLSYSWIVSLLIVSVIFVFVWLMINWDDIWSKENE